MTSAHSKTCKRCGTEKPLSQFYVSKTSKDGYRSICIDCNTEQNKAYRLAHGMKPRSQSKKAIAELLGVKKCTECGKTLPVENFVKGQSSCKSCRNKKRVLQAREKGIKPRDFEQIEAKANGFIICKKCNRKKDLSEFQKRSDTGNYMLVCKDCKRQYLHEYYSNNKNNEGFIAARKKWQEEHAEEIRERSRLHYEANKERHYEIGKKWREKHAEEVRAYKKQYRDENKEHIREVVRAYWAIPENKERKRQKNREYQKQEKVRIHRREYQRSRMGEILRIRKERMNSDPLYRVKIRIGKLVGVSLRQRGYSKQTRTYKLIGLQYEDLWDYLKRTWFENYGTEYHNEPYEIDHIHPLSDAKTEKELLELWSYENLQLLTPEDNGDKLDKLNWKPPMSSKANGRLEIKNGKRILLKKMAHLPKISH